MPNSHTEQPSDLRAVPQQESQDHIAELRQVLTDILPSGSDTASAQSTEVSHRGSMDKHKRPAMEKQHKFPPAYCNGQGRHSQHCGLTAQDSQETPFKRPSLEAGRELSKIRPPLPSSISLGSSEPDHGLVGKRVLFPQLLIMNLHHAKLVSLVFPTQHEYLCSFKAFGLLSSRKP